MDSYWVIKDDDSDISHYGVKGMKLGVRKQRKQLRKSLKQVNRNLKKAANTRNEKKRAKFMARYKDAEKSYNSAVKALEKSGFSVGEIMSARIGRSGDIYAVRKAKVGSKKSSDRLSKELLRSQKRRERAKGIISAVSDMVL